MNAEILVHLEQSAKKGEPLPTWSQIGDLKTSAEALQECVECVIRGKLLFNIQEQLKTQKVSAKFYSGDGKEIEDLSAYDPRFDDEVNLGIRITDALIACIGVNWKECPTKNSFVFSGYMKNSNDEECKLLETVVKNTFKEQPARYDSPKWYAYCWNENINYNNAPDADTVGRLASKLIAMSKEMHTALGIEIGSHHNDRP